MKRFAIAAMLSAMSLGACAQTAPPADTAKAPVETAAPVKPAPEAKVLAGTPEARVRDVLKQLSPKVSIDRIGPAPVPGFREVVAGGQVVYVSDDGKYLFQGGLLDIAQRKNLAEDAMAKLRSDVLKTLPMKDRIVFAPTGTPKHTVVVLTDIECGYCRKFHNDIAEYTKRGIQVEYMAFPRAGIGSADYKKMVSVWCADDRRKALTDAKNDRSIATKSCTNPVNMQYAAGQRMGLEGTPMLLTTDGQFLGGYLPPDALLQRLEKIDQERSVGKGG